jgi:serine/threonine protein kinase
MKPSAPAGLMEKWIIPILREVAEALKWVHQAGIIHRDIKCRSCLIAVFTTPADAAQVQMFLLQSKVVYNFAISALLASSRTS